MRERLDIPANYFDNLLLWLVDKSPSNKGYDERVEQHKTAHKGPRDALGGGFDFYAKLFDVLDAKSSALLTHISIMIAVVSVVLPKHDPNVWLKSAYLLILLSFFLTAICLIRCLRFWSAPLTDEKEPNYVKTMNEELHRRSEFYRFACQLTFLTTIASIIPFIIVFW